MKTSEQHDYKPPSLWMVRRKLQHEVDVALRKAIDFYAYACVRFEISDRINGPVGSMGVNIESQLMQDARTGSSK